MEEEVKRETCLFYRTYYDVVKALPEDKKLPYLMNILDFFFENETLGETGDPLLDIALLSIKRVVEANEKNFWNGKKGGAPKGNRNAVKNNPETTENNQNKGQNNLKQPKTTKTTPLVLENNGKQPMVDLKNNGKQPNEKGEMSNEKGEMSKGDGCFFENVLDCCFNIFEEEDSNWEYTRTIWEKDWDSFDWDSLEEDYKIDMYYSINSLRERLMKEYDNGFVFYRLPGHFPDALKLIICQHLEDLPIKLV